MTFVRERAEKFDLGRVVSRMRMAFRGRISNFYAVALISLGVPTAVVQFLQLGAGSASAGVSPLVGMFSLMAVVGGLVLLVAKVVCNCLLISGALAAIEGRTQAFGDQLRAGLAFFLPVLGVYFISEIAIGATLILLIVPGLITMCSLCVAIPAELAERTGVFGALSRSRVLTRGHRWSILGALLLYGVAVSIFSGVLAMVVGMIFFGGFGKSYLTAGVSPLAYVGVILMALVSAGVAMATAVGLAALYTELRLLKDGPQTQSLAEVFA